MHEILQRPFLAISTFETSLAGKTLVSYALKDSIPALILGDSSSESKYLYTLLPFPWDWLTNEIDQVQTHSEGKRRVFFAGG